MTNQPGDHQPGTDWPHTAATAATDATAGTAGGTRAESFHARPAHADVPIPGEPEGSARVPSAEQAGKGVINLVHLYPAR